MAARASSSSSDDVLSEESDSNALNLYDSDGNNSEPFFESGPRAIRVRTPPGFG